MKIYYKILSLALFISVIIGCKKYDDYEIDYNSSSVYFSYQRPVRTLVANGNTITFDAGVTLGGKRKNNKDETVEFKVDPTLLNDATLMNGRTFQLLPADYYTLSNPSKIVIPSGSFQGTVQVTLNNKFLSDPLALNNTYVLPLVITSATTDRILKGSVAAGVARKDYTLIVVKFINKYNATYYHRGFRYTYDATGKLTETLRYVRPEEETQYLKNHIWNLSSLGTSELLTDGVEFLTTQSGRNYSMKLAVDANNKVSIANNAASLIKNIVDNGNSSYDTAKKQFYLYYQYTDVAGTTYKMSDTLIYRNVDLKLEQW